jgi:hypothetical protein
MRSTCFSDLAVSLRLHSDPAQMTGQCSYEHSSPTKTDLNCSAHQLSLSVFLKVL